ncbi:MAG: ZIP family metal transporter [Bacilli bacterium]|jgi:ZIP family zinc transporter
MKILLGFLIPLIGTTLGAALVLLLKGQLNKKIKKAMLGFAAGVMVAASIWSLINPAIEMSESLGVWTALPAAVGFLIGVGFLLLLDTLVPHLHSSGIMEGRPAKFNRTVKMMFAVTLHNIPEGMAVGIVLAGVISGQEIISMNAALALSIGIALQNFPEGAIISLPFYQEGHSKKKSFFLGFLSGVVEPIAAVLTMLLVSIVEPILPYVLAFAAGAMMYVVVEELIPDSQTETHSNIPTVAFALGFVLMMVLDVTLG